MSLAYNQGKGVGGFRLRACGCGAGRKPGKAQLTGFGSEWQQTSAEMHSVKQIVGFEAQRGASEALAL